MESKKTNTSNEIEFMLFLDFVISENNLNILVKEKFLFLSYEKYFYQIKLKNKFVVFEDWWINKPEVVKSKIKSILGISKRIFARKCELRKITKPIADIFLEENHIYGTTKSKVKIGLFNENILFGVVTFAGQRQFHDGSRSVELLRYCNKSGYTIVGGLDKLLKAYIKNYKPNSIMTYIDLNWGRGNAFIKLGFNKKEIKPPIVFYVNKNTGNRISKNKFKNFNKISDFTKIKNNGSVKLILPIK